MRDKGLICLSSGTNGSAGDVRPLVALALALRERGFEILMLGDAAFERSALHAGIRPSEWFACSEVPQTFWLRTAAGQRGLWGQRPRYWDRWLKRELAQHWTDRLERFWRKVGGPDNPRVVAAIGSITATRWLMAFGPRTAKIVSCPMPYQPSKYLSMAPPDLSRLERLRAWIRRGSTNLETRRRFCEELFHLVSASPSILPRPADWLPNMQVTGYTPLDDDGLGWAPSEQLHDFLKQGPPPVYIGFGAHAVLRGRRGARLWRELLEGCRRAGVRCIFQSPDLPGSMASDRVLIVDGDVSHAWLFARCVAVVHHGGYGTTHAALVARRPMIIYPFQTDQFLWAARIGELGAGPGFTSRLRSVSAARFERDLAFVLGRPCRKSAERVGAAVSSDRGLPLQVAAIESAVEHIRRGLRPPDWTMPELARGEEPRPLGTEAPPAVVAPLQSVMSS